MVGYRLIGLFGLIILLNGCSHTTTISIETLEPPTVFFLNPHNSITINYRCFNGKHASGISSVDSLAADAIVYEMISTIKQNPMFELTNIVTTQESVLSNLTTDYLLSANDLSLITTKTKGDVILSLDNLSIVADTTYAEVFNNYISVKLDVHLSGLWRVYSPVTKEVLGTYQYEDSVQWYSVRESKELALNDIPTLTEITSWIGRRNGDVSAKLFAPFWNISERQLYSGSNCCWNQAIISAQENDWDNALKIWNLQLGNNKSSQHKWKGAYNLAVASEVKNDVLLALNWLDLADSFMPGTPEVRAYREALQLRLKSQKILDLIK